MNEKQFLFVTCVNNEGLYGFCTHHINQLVVPPSYEIEMFPVRDAKSMAEGYNRALEHKAKYKIYLHQDTLIMNKNFLQDILTLFITYSNLGLLGLVGGIGNPPSGYWGESKNVGKWMVYSTTEKKYKKYRHMEVTNPFQPVDLVDGFLMATQYDIPWRADLFTGFHLYDSSQCREFQKKGYIVGIPRQNQYWAAHYLDHPIDNEEWKKHQEVYRKHYVEGNAVSSTSS